MASTSTTAGAAGGSGSISSLYHECLSILNQLYALEEIQVRNPTTREEPTKSPVIAGELARFRIWSANSGAHHPAGSKYSLDYRLQDAAHAKKLLLLVLEKMKIVLLHGTLSKALTER